MEKEGGGALSETGVVGTSGRQGRQPGGNVIGVRRGTVVTAREEPGRRPRDLRMPKENFTTIARERESRNVLSPRAPSISLLSGPNMELPIGEGRG